MTDNRSKFEDQFDATLRKAMGDHRQQVPEGFADSIMQRLRSQQFAASDSQAKEEFEIALKSALVEYNEPVSEGFAGAVMRRVRAQQERKLITRMAWQERFILAGFAGLFVIVSGLIFLFSGPITEMISSSMSNLTTTGSLLVNAAMEQWRLLVWTLAAIVMVIYSFASSGLFRIGRT